MTIGPFPSTRAMPEVSITGTNPFQPSEPTTVVVNDTRLFSSGAAKEERSLGAFTRDMPLSATLTPRRPGVGGRDSLCRVTLSTLGGVIILDDVDIASARAFIMTAAPHLAATNAYPPGSCQRCGHSSVNECNTSRHRDIPTLQQLSDRRERWRDYARGLGEPSVTLLDTVRERLQNSSTPGRPRPLGR